jgi:hypothetical protein
VIQDNLEIQPEFALNHKDGTSKDDKASGNCRLNPMIMCLLIKGIDSAASKFHH